MQPNAATLRHAMRSCEGGGSGGRPIALLLDESLSASLGKAFPGPKYPTEVIEPLCLAIKVLPLLPKTNSTNWFFYNSSQEAPYAASLLAVVGFRHRL